MTQLNECEFFEIIEQQIIPEERQASEGIEQLNLYKYKENAALLHSNPEQGLQGPEPLKGVERIIRSDFPQFIHVIDDWKRPKATADAIFSDFNKPQYEIESFSPQRLIKILPLVDHFLQVKPIDIVHWNDTQYYKWRQSSKADYRHVHDLERNRLTKPLVSSGESGPTKKARYLDIQLKADRSSLHYVKEYGHPFQPMKRLHYSKRLKNWMLKHPIELLVRSHISKPPVLKLRPVYNAPLFYQRIEIMLYWAIFSQLRKPESCLMYGLETIRGGMRKVDQYALNYESYIMIDWSSFDQTLPYAVTEIFFKYWLPTKICVDQGYAETINMQNHLESFIEQAKELEGMVLPGDDLTKCAQAVYSQKVSNILDFMETWFKNFVYITPDGYAYKRKHAGMPSGIMGTQFLDSFGNLLIILDCLLEYGLTSEEIMKMKMFIMGDDNVIFTHYSAHTATEILEFITSYAKYRFGMTINVVKSSSTCSRKNIEIIGYQNLFGIPIRSTEKLVAQLMYPERHVTDADMCVRSVGIAYASCGMDIQMYKLCCRVYEHYKSKIKSEELVMRRQAVHGLFWFVEEEESLPDLTIMPTLNELQHLTLHYQGPLSEEPTWKYDLFVSPPEIRRPTRLTLSEFNDNYGYLRHRAKYLMYNRM